jgi:outer membrane protein TolC
VTFINVLQAQSALLMAQDQVAQSEQALDENLVSVYKAMGGGWSPGAESASQESHSKATVSPE